VKRASQICWGVTGVAAAGRTQWLDPLGWFVFGLVVLLYAASCLLRWRR
jgi:hypothetical protein